MVVSIVHFKAEHDFNKYNGILLTKYDDLVCCRFHD